MAADRILVVGPSWVGDMIMAQTLYQVLRHDDPACAIDVLAPAWSAGILARMPEVRRSIEAPFGHGQFGWGARRALGRALRGRYERAFVLPNSWKSALVPWFAGIPRRTGFVGEFRHGLLNDARRLDKVALPRLVDRYRALAGPGAGTVEARPRLRVDEAACAATLARLGLTLDRPVLALCPGAEYGPAKRWPSGHYAALARVKLAAGWQVWLYGSAKDAGVTGEINTLAGGGCVDLAGRTSLTDAADLLSRAAAVVTNDSGLMHLAAAVAVPVIALYGSSDPGYTPPLSDRARVVSLGLSCSPCFKRECPLGHLDCLNRLEPERVLAELDAALARPGAPA